VDLRRLRGHLRGYNPGHAEVLVRVCGESDVAIARQRTRELAAHQGLSGAATEALATAVSEIARNIVVHASAGEVWIAAVAEHGKRGVAVTALDSGPGIANIAQAMQDGFSSTGSLGFGLPGARRLVDEFAIESTVGTGTRITLRTWASQDPV
jgi:serine/threonine-protein kinase RsbT